MGSELISELGRRGELGMYFDFLSYRKLRKIDSPSELRQFLDAHGYQSASEQTDVSGFADALQQSQNEEATSNALLVAALSDPTGILSLLILPVMLAKALFGSRTKTS